MTLLKTQQAAAEWWAAHRQEDRVSYPRYARNARSFQELFAYVVRCPFYDDRNGQNVFAFTMPPTGDIAPVAHEVAILLPLIRPIDGARNILIYDYTEGSDGSVGLQQDAAGAFHLTMTVYGVTTIVRSFATLTEALSYVQAYHPFVLASEVTV